MSNIGLSTDLVLANTSTRSGTLVLPLTTQIPGRTITIKDSAGAAALSTIFISTTGGDTFQDGTTTQSLMTSYGFMKLTARATKWYITATTQPPSYTATTVRVPTTQATLISTLNITTSSLTLYTLVGTPFSPLSIQGCALWLDGNDVNGTGTNVSNGTSLTQWVDKSGNGNTTTTEVGTITMTSNAIGAYSAPYFPPNSYFLGPVTYAGTAIYHFAVATLNSGSASYGRILSMGRPSTNDYDNATTEFAFIRNGGQNLMIGRSSSYLSVSIPAYSTPFLVQSSQNGSIESIGVNGVLSPSTQNTGQAGNFNITLYGIGTNTNTSDGGGVYNGYIAEVIVYTGTVLTTAQIQSVEGYLARKWGLTGLLPTGHPGLKPTTSISSGQSFRVSSSLGYWGPYLLNSGFRSAQPQVFYPRPPFLVTTSNATLGTDYTITSNSAGVYYNFFTTGTTMYFTTAVTQTVSYLALGGGGGGSCENSGGGGAGGLLSNSSFVLTPGTYTVVIGVGGAGGTNTTGGAGPGSNGGNTIFASNAGSNIAIAQGGGYGGFNRSFGQGANGGCGGGAGSQGTSGTGSQGGNGGAAGGSGGGGGGGVGGNGGNSTASVAGSGGIGITFNNGTTLQLGGGGGGSSYTTGTRGLGVYGGGNGGTDRGAGSSATSNTGSGGGGGGSYSGLGGAGGSGFFSIWG